MTNLLRLFLTIIATFTFGIFLFTTTLYFQLLNKDFIISSLRHPLVYQNLQKGILSLANDLIYQGVSKNDNYAQLSDTQKTLLDAEIEKALNFITVENVSDFTEVNLNHVFDYADNQSQSLVLYLPLKKWNLPVGIVSQIPPIYTTENIDVIALANSGEITIDKTKIENIRQWKITTKKVWLVNVLVFILSIFAIATIDINDHKLKRTANLLIFFGIIAIVSAAGLNLVKNVFNFGSSDQIAPLNLLLSAIIPVFFSRISTVWLTVGIATVICGLAIHFLYQPKNSKSIQKYSGQKQSHF